MSNNLEIMVGGKIPLELESITEVSLLELLGTGAFGSVWKVEDSVTKQVYVLKVIQDIEPDSHLAERVRLEAEVNIASDYIIPVIGLQQWNETTYLILFEYFSGKSLDKVLEKESLTDNQKRFIFQQTLTGVGDAHRCNIIHRDLKPGNILVSEDFNVKIIDFGISKFKEKPLTRQMDMLGTVPFIAPEVLINGAIVADARSDIYALGHIFYELITGKHFWVYKSWVRGLEDFIDYLQQVPPPTEGIELDDLCCDLYLNTKSILSRMVKINPEARFSSVDEILSSLGYIPYMPELPQDLEFRYPLLIVESGSNKGARTLINLSDGETLVMGRADIAGGNESISRRHLEFSRSGSNYFVSDIGSKNGTLVKGIAIKPHSIPILIQHCDRIKVGDIFLRFVLVTASS